jgi:hypothetical protein
MKILNAGCVDNNRQQMSADIDQNVALTAFDFLVVVKAF